MDVRKSPYAHFLENMIKGVMAEQPKHIGVCMLLPTGDAATIYYGYPSHQDVAVMSYHLSLDAMMGVVRGNADQIVNAAEDIEEENNGTDCNDD